MNAFQMIRISTVAAGMLAAASCVHVKTDPIEFKPIRVEMNVNIRIQKELENFFSFEDDVLKNPGGPATRPSAAPASPSL